MKEYIYGRNSVLQRIKEKGEIIVLYVSADVVKKDKVILENKETLNVVVKSRGFLDSKVKNKNHQGYIAEIKPYSYYSVVKMEEELKEKKNPTILMLDNIYDPHNFGAILRSCESSGVDYVIVGKNSSCPLNATVSKTSSGAIERVKVVLVNNLSKMVLNFKEKNYLIVASEYRQESKDYREINFNKPLLVIVGSEGKGISKKLIKDADILTKIPMVGKINSLNVSVASALILYKIFENKNPL